MVVYIIDAALRDFSGVQWQQQGMNVQINLRYDSLCKFPQQKVYIHQYYKACSFVTRYSFFQCFAVRFHIWMENLSFNIEVFLPWSLEKAKNFRTFFFIKISVNFCGVLSSITILYRQVFKRKTLMVDKILVLFFTCTRYFFVRTNKKLWLLLMSYEFSEHIHVKVWGPFVKWIWSDFHPNILGACWRNLSK